MNISTLSRPARLFLLERLERLHDALEGLGQRLRAGIAHVIGSEIGEAVRDAIAHVLHAQPSSPSPQSHRGGPRDHGTAERESGWEPHDYGEGFWNGYDPEPFGLPPEVEEKPKPSRWKPLLAGLVQLVSWWLRRQKRPSLLKLAGVGAAVSAATLIAGPIAGGAVTAFGTAVLLARMADETTKAFGRFSDETAR